MLEGRPYDISAVEIGPRGEWVLYPTGVKRTPSHRSWLTQRLLIEVAPGRPLPALTGIAGISGVKINGRFQLLSVDGGPAAALRKAGLLALLPGVLKAEPLLARQLITRVIPDDPYFAWQAGEPGYQWHLRNSGQNGGIAGIDLNITQAWNRWTGRGVTLGIVDDGLETTHADLVAHVDIMNGYDFNEKDADPSPGSSNHHGTACAGAAAATGNNSQGVSGAAPDAMLAGLRLVSAPTTDEDEAAAFLHASGEIAIKSNSWGPDDD